MDKTERRALTPEELQARRTQSKMHEAELQEAERAYMEIRRSRREAHAKACAEFLAQKKALASDPTVHTNLATDAAAFKPTITPPEEK